MEVIEENRKLSQDDDSYNVSETEQLKNTLYINIIIFSCLTLLFEILRHMKSIYMNRYKKKFIEENRVPKKPSSLPFGWVYTIFTVSHDDILRMVGLDGYILLRYLMTCIRIATFCAFWGLIVIVPVYGSGSVGLTGWNKYTIANIPDDPGSNQLWVPVIFSYLFAMFYCQLLYFEYKNFIHKRVMYLEDGDPETPEQTYYTVMLEKIPASLRSTTILKDFFERLYPGDVFAVEIALDLNELDEIATRRKQVRNSLEKSIAIWKGTGKRPRTLVKKEFYDNEVPNKPLPVQEWSIGSYFGYELYDSIEHYSKLLSILNQNVKQMQLVYIEQRHRLNEIENNRLEEIRKVYAIRALETASKQVKRFAGNLKDTSTQAANNVVSNILHFKEEENEHHHYYPQDSVDGTNMGDEETAAGQKDALLIRDSDENRRKADEENTSKRDSDSSKLRDSVDSSRERKSESSKSKLKNLVENSSARAQEVIHIGAKIVGSGVEGLAKEGLKTAKFATKGALRGVYEATRALELLTLGAYYKTSSTAFITFKTRFSACCCQQMLLSHEHYMIDVTPAPNPNDVIWQNVSIPLKQIEIRKQISDSTLIVGAFFWSIVVAFISAISNLESLSQEIPSLQEYSNTQIYKFLNNYLAVGILLILLALLPFVFDFISRNYEGVKLESEIQNSIMSRYFYYQLANVFVAVGLGSIANSIHEILQNPSSILSILGSSVPSFSIYFANLIITRAFTGIPIEMLRIFPLLDIVIVQYCSNKKKLTRRELMEGAFADPPMVYGWIYPNILMGLMIMVTYSCIAPMILIFCAVFFMGLYLMYKYQLLYVYINNYQSGGYMWYAVFDYSMLALIAGVVTLACYLAIRQTFVSGPFYAILPLPVMISYFWRHCNTVFKRPASTLSLERAKEIDQIFQKSHIDVVTNGDFSVNRFRQPNLAEGDLKAAVYRHNQFTTELRDLSSMISLERETSLYEVGPDDEELLKNEEAQKDVDAILGTSSKRSSLENGNDLVVPSSSSVVSASSSTKNLNSNNNNNAANIEEGGEPSPHGNFHVANEHSPIKNDLGQGKDPSNSSNGTYGSIIP